VRHLARWGAVAASGLLVVVSAGIATGSVHTGKRNGDPIPAALSAQTCPAATHPGDGSTQPYRLAFTGTLTGTLRINASPVGAITLPPIDGTFCGRLELPIERASVAPRDLHFSPVTVRIARANVPARIGGEGVTVGSVGVSPAANGGLDLTLAAPVGARTGLFGVSCLLPVDLRLSTTAAGGSPLVGPLTNARATITQTGFTIGRAESTGTAGTCPSYLAARVDRLVGLPNVNTSSTVAITLDVVVP
jgi:hypothetical protein